MCGGCHWAASFFSIISMIQIDDKIISSDVFLRKYCCDLSKCAGECCVEGDSGAPLDDAETEILEKIYPIVEPYLNEKERAEIARQGKWVIDDDGDKVTPIINGRECVYTYRDEDGCWKCAIERAYREGKIDFYKPISCHLYPIRVTKYTSYEALNVHDWTVCKAAKKLGEKLGLPVYKFLREPLIRKYGEEFYHQLEIAAPEVERSFGSRK